MWISRGRLAGDVARWRQAGWVTAEGEAAIRAEIAASRSSVGLAGVLAILGVVLLGFGVMSFVAANWQDIPRLARLGVIVAGLIASYAAAGALAARGLKAFAEAALLSGVAIFGAGIMLVAQMYHIDGNPPDAVLTWAAGALLVGVLLGSNAALAAAALLTALWSGWEMVLTQSVHWPALAAAAILALAFWRQGWRPGAHLVGAGLAAWVISLGLLLEMGAWESMVLPIGLAAMALGLFGARHAQRLAPVGPLLTGYGFATAFTALFALQFLQRAGTDALVAWGVVALALSLALVALALAAQAKGLVWLGYVGFAIEILGLYFKTVGTLLGSSVFFLSAGLVVIALAVVAWRLHARAALAIQETTP